MGRMRGKREASFEEFSCKSGGARQGEASFLFSFLHGKDIDVFTVFGEGACGERLKRKNSKSRISEETERG